MTPLERVIETIEDELDSSNTGDGYIENTTDAIRFLVRLLKIAKDETQPAQSS